MRDVRMIKMLVTLFSLLFVLPIAGCNLGDVSHHSVKNLDNIDHVFDGRYLLSATGQVVISREELIHSPDDETGSFVQIDHLKHVVKVVSAESRSFALTDNGQVWFWGEPLDYEPSGLFNPSPQVKRPKKFPRADQVIDLWGSYGGLILKKEDGTFWGWNAFNCSYPVNDEPVQPHSGNDELLSLSWISDAKDISDCGTVLKQDGTVWETKNGALKPIAGLRDIVEIQGGYPIDRNGEVWSWGSYDEHPSIMLNHVVQVSGEFALKIDGSVWYLPDKSKLADLKDIKEIGGNWSQVYAISKAGKVYVGDSSGSAHELSP